MLSPKNLARSFMFFSCSAFCSMMVPIIDVRANIISSTIVSLTEAKNFQMLSEILDGKSPCALFFSFSSRGYLLKNQVVNNSI